MAEYILSFRMMISCIKRKDPTLKSKCWTLSPNLINLLTEHNTHAKNDFVDNLLWEISFQIRALILVQNPLLKHVHPLYSRFMVGFFIRKGLIFPQNPFHKTHKDLSASHCPRREITLPGEKAPENILFKFFNFGRFSHFCGSTFRALGTHPI